MLPISSVFAPACSRFPAMVTQAYAAALNPGRPAEDRGSPLYCWNSGNKISTRAPPPGAAMMAILPACASTSVRTTFLLLASAFIYYWHHRLSHRLRWRWATHVVHHSTTRLNLSSSIRLGLTGSLTGNRLFFLPLIFIGFHPFVCRWPSVSTSSTNSSSTPSSCHASGPLEWIFNTRIIARITRAMPRASKRISTAY